jgi:hypothetical protein
MQPGQLAIEKRRKSVFRDDQVSGVFQDEENTISSFAIKSQRPKEY